MSFSVDDLLGARRVLCVQPHYDDNDLGAGGTIAALADAGAEIHYLTVTDDQLGVLDASLSVAEARDRLRAEQARAAREIGVAEQHWLDLPDAGPWDYYEVRTSIVEHVRRLRADLLLTADPWLPHEAHGDHRRTGLAAAEAALLYRFPRVKTQLEVDAAYPGHELVALAFYFTTDANLCVDIGSTRDRKHRAIDAYVSQFRPEELAALHTALDGAERLWAHEQPFTHGEALKVLAPQQLHVDLDPRPLAHR